MPILRPKRIVKAAREVEAKRAPIRKKAIKKAPAKKSAPVRAKVKKPIAK